MNGRPTPHAEVNTLLGELLGDVRAVLGAQFVGAYLFGSLACGDFDRDSDVDVLVVTEGELSGGEFEALRAMHERLARADSPWATQLEVSYIPRASLRRRDPARAVHPHIDRGVGEVLRLAQHDEDRVVQRHTLRERGVTLTGPDPRTLIDPVSPDELRGAMLSLVWWLEEILGDPARIGRRGYQSYIVLTMCRVLYTLRHGSVVSKRAAARWAAEESGGRWAALIGRTWESRSRPREPARPEDVSETLALIRHTIERAREYESYESSAGESED
jgi:predicted nucleotidyltransferase